MKEWPESGDETAIFCQFWFTTCVCVHPKTKGSPLRGALSGLKFKVKVLREKFYWVGEGDSD